MPPRLLRRLASQQRMGSTVSVKFLAALALIGCCCCSGVGLRLGAAVAPVDEVAGAASGGISPFFDAQGHDGGAGSAVLPSAASGAGPPGSAAGSARQLRLGARDVGGVTDPDPDVSGGALGQPAGTQPARRRRARRQCRDGMPCSGATGTAGALLYEENPEHVGPHV